MLWILHLWRHLKPKRTQSWQPDLLGPAQSNYLDLMISRGAFKHQELCDFLKNKALEMAYCSLAMLHTLLLLDLLVYLFFVFTIYTGFCPKANHTYNLKFWVERHCTHTRDCGKPTARWPIFFPEYAPRCVNTAMNRATSSAIQELKIASTKSWWSDWGFENFQYDIARTKLSYI